MTEFIPSVEHRLKEFLSAPDYQPLRQNELARALNLVGEERRELRHILRRLESDGFVVCLRKNRWARPASGRTVVGSLSVTRNGNAFLIAEAPDQPDVFIARNQQGVALHGDRVMVDVRRVPHPRASWQQPDAELETAFEGRVVRVLERRTFRVAGLFRRTAQYAYVIPDQTRILHNVRVRGIDLAGQPDLTDHKVVVALDEWEDERRPLTGRVVEDLGRTDAPGVVRLSFLRSHDIYEEFPPAVDAEARRHGGEPGPKDREGRRDLRDLLTFTIDPEDARDYDDAVSLDRLPDGTLRLGVHIADVAHYVPRNSSMDQEARQRGTSVYLVDQVITMLPPYLTTEVCSLVAGRDRLTHTVSLHMDDEGNVLDFETFPSVIHSRARLTYEQVQRLLMEDRTDAIPPEVARSLRAMHRFAATLRARRMRQGSIDLSMPEVRCVLDAQGRTVDIVRRTSYESYQLIEEFMLAANRAVAELLVQREVPAVYRVHEKPEEQQWAQMAEDLEALGFHATPESSFDITRIAHQVRGQPREALVNLSMLRNLKRAMYAPTCDGHFGLAFDRYLHFTSPIRRYPDLLVHRVLKAVELNVPPPYTRKDVGALAVHCSARERQADEASRDHLDQKRLELFEQRLWKGDTGPYRGVITGTGPKGFFVELTDSLLRGMVHFSSLRGRFRVADHGARLMGPGSKVAFCVGQEVQVMLARVDTARRMVDFRIAEEGAEGARPAPEKKRGGTGRAGKGKKSRRRRGAGD